MSEPLGGGSVFPHSASRDSEVTAYEEPPPGALNESMNGTLMLFSATTVPASLVPFGHVQSLIVQNRLLVKLADHHKTIVAPATEVAAGTDASTIAWCPVERLPDLAFDHREIARRAIELLSAPAY